MRVCELCKEYANYAMSIRIMQTVFYMYANLLLLVRYAVPTYGKVNTPLSHLDLYVERKIPGRLLAAPG